MTDDKPKTLSNSKPPKAGEGIHPGLPHAKSDSLVLTNTLNKNSDVPAESLTVTFSSQDGVTSKVDMDEDDIIDYIKPLPEKLRSDLSMSEHHPQNILNRLKRVERAINAIAEGEQARISRHNSDGGNMHITKKWLSDWQETQPNRDGVIETFPGE